MLTYQFQALNAHGKKICGVIPANNRNQALQLLKSKHLYPIKLYPQRFSWLNNNYSGIWTIEWAKDVGFFLKQGLSLLESLQTSKLRLKSSQKQMIELIIEKLYAGVPLSKVLQEYKVFPKLFLGLLRVAEVTGQYAQAFEDYAKIRGEEQQFFKQLRNSLQYPVILVVVILFMVVSFGEFLLPTAIEFFSRNNLEQHLATKLFIHFSNYLSKFFLIFTNWQFLIGGLVGFYYISKFSQAKYYLGWLMIKLPIFGHIYLQTLQSLYLKSFSTLLSRGHNVLLAAHYSGEVLKNQYLKKQSANIDSSIQQTGRISESISVFLKLPLPLANLLETGEKTANLAVYSDICAQSLQNHSRAILQSILVWTGPILISIIGILMIWMVVAIVVPLYDQIARMD